MTSELLDVALVSAAAIMACRVKLFQNTLNLLLERR